jgi:hypothetical protein
MSIIKKKALYKTKNTMCPSQNDQKREKEGHNDGSSDRVLIKEIDSWSNFEYALREESRLLFKKMVSECRENEDYATAASFKDEYFSADSLFMVLILQQQNMINKLIAKVSERKRSLGKLTEWMDRY